MVRSALAATDGRLAPDVHFFPHRDRPLSFCSNVVVFGKTSGLDYVRRPIVRVIRSPLYIIFALSTKNVDLVYFLDKRHSPPVSLSLSFSRLTTEAS